MDAREKLRYLTHLNAYQRLQSDRMQGDTDMPTIAPETAIPDGVSVAAALAQAQPQSAPGADTTATASTTSGRSSRHGFVEENIATPQQSSNDAWAAMAEQSNGQTDG
jgi:hypothetical protein